MFWVPLAMAAYGALQGQKQQEQEKRDRELQAATASFSPWTKLQPQAVQPRGDMMSGAASGLGSGLSMQQNMDKNAMDKNFYAQMMARNQQINDWNTAHPDQRPAGLGGMGGGY